MQAEHGVVKAKGSWVTLDTPAQKIRVPYFPPHLHHYPEVSVGLSGGKICMHSRIYFFLCEQTFLTACDSRLDNTSYSMQNLLSLYILHIKYIKLASLESIFLVHPKNLLTHKCVGKQAHRGFLSPCYLYNHEAKM